MSIFGVKWFKDGSLIGEFSDHLGLAIPQKNQAIALQAAKVDAELASIPGVDKRLIINGYNVLNGVSQPDSVTCSNSAPAAGSA